MRFNHRFENTLFGLFLVVGIIFLAFQFNLGPWSDMNVPKNEPAPKVPEQMFSKSVDSGHVESYEFIDSRDGRKYRTIKIGSLTWLAEDLDLSERKERRASEVVYNKFNALRACPAGWKLPGDKEWNALTFMLNKVDEFSNLLPLKNELEQARYWSSSGKFYAFDHESGTAKLVRNSENQFARVRCVR